MQKNTNMKLQNWRSIYKNLKYLVDQMIKKGESLKMIKKILEKIEKKKKVDALFAICKNQNHIKMYLEEFERKNFEIIKSPFEIIYFYHKSKFIKVQARHFKNSLFAYLQQEYLKKNILLKLKETQKEEFLFNFIQKVIYVEPNMILEDLSFENNEIRTKLNQKNKARNENEFRKLFSFVFLLWHIYEILKKPKIIMKEKKKIDNSMQPNYNQNKFISQKNVQKLQTNQIQSKTNVSNQQSLVLYNPNQFFAINQQRQNKNPQQFANINIQKTNKNILQRPQSKQNLNIKSNIIKLIESINPEKFEQFCRIALLMELSLQQHPLLRYTLLYKSCQQFLDKK